MVRWATAAACASSRLRAPLTGPGARRNVSTRRFHHRPPTEVARSGCTNALRRTNAPAVGPGHSMLQKGFCRLRSERADVLRLRALRTLGDVELNLLVLIERAVSAAGDGRVVREHVGAAVLGSNEAEALFSVEPLHGASCHNLFSSKSALSIPIAGADRRGVRRPLQTGTKRTPGTRPQAFKTCDAPVSYT